MNRVAFVVDGFNVYHSLLEAQTVLRRPVKWLDLRRFCASYTRRDVFGRPSELRSVSYFSAYATFMAATDPNALTHHRTYVEALRATGKVRPIAYAHQQFPNPVIGADKPETW